MTPQSFETAFPPNSGETLLDHITRVIQTNSGSTRDAISHLCDCIEEIVQQRQDDRIDADLFRAQSELTTLQKAHAALMRKQAALPSMISKMRAESAIRMAVEGMRERAAQLVEGRDGEPTAASEAIRAIPDPNIERLIQQARGL